MVKVPLVGGFLQWLEELGRWECFWREESSSGWANRDVEMVLCGRIPPATGEIGTLGVSLAGESRQWLDISRRWGEYDGRIPPVTGENRTQREVQACKTAAKVGDMKMSDDEFERAIEDALAGIPDRFKQVLENVGIAMAQEPNERELGTMCDAGGELLGLYEGIAITRRTTAYSGVMPDVITIFKGPHERVCATRAQMVKQIRKTVLHEIGHYFGFDDAYLHAHGY